MEIKIHTIVCKFEIITAYESDVAKRGEGDWCRFALHSGKFSIFEFHVICSSEI